MEAVLFTQRAKAQGGRQKNCHNIIVAAASCSICTLLNITTIQIYLNRIQHQGVAVRGSGVWMPAVASIRHTSKSPKNLPG